MCTAQTAKRRRAQARNGYRHIGPLRRPHFNKRDAETSAKRLQRLIETERRMKQKAKR